MQDKLDVRFYTTTLPFARDLSQAVNVGINTQLKPPPADKHHSDPTDASPAKQSIYNNVKERQRLGRRILRTIQPLLEAALKAESEICNEPLDTLLEELESTLEPSLEIRQPIVTASHENGSAPDQDQDVEMADAPAEAQIIVADQSDGEIIAEVDGEAGTRTDDAMDLDPAQHARSNIEVNTSEHGNSVSSRPNGIVSSSASPARKQQPKSGDNQDDGGSQQRINGFKKVDSGSPPSVAGYNPATLQPPQHPPPLTPPPSNGGSVGSILSEGGLPRYLQGFDIKGTSAVEEQWTGRDAIRDLTEDLTDMDEDALKVLEFDVDDDTITASPVNAGTGEGSNETSESSNKVTRKRERPNPAKFRKGVRSSARRR